MKRFHCTQARGYPNGTEERSSGIVLRSLIFLTATAHYSHLHPQAHFAGCCRANCGSLSCALRCCTGYAFVGRFDLREHVGQVSPPTAHF